MTIRQVFACTVALVGGALATASGAQAQSAFGDPLFAVLVGGNECNGAAPPAGPVCRKGEPKAIGSATVIFPDRTTVCWAITIDNVPSPTLAHIHKGAASVNGPPVVTLVPPVAPGNGNPGTSSGCVKNADLSVVAAIRADPTSFYVNVHSKQFPAGAARGQLH